MSTQTNPFYFRRRNFRAASPTIFACYEQVRYEDEDYSDSDSASCSEDDEDYVNAVSHSDEPSHDDDSDGDGLGVGCAPTASGAKRENSVMRDGASGTVDSDDLEMEMEMGEDDGSPDRGSADTQAQQQQQQRDLKGKQRAVDPPEPQPRGSGHRQAKKRRQPTYTLRPILTIQRSQGFVWNQVRTGLYRWAAAYRSLPCDYAYYTGSLCPALHQG